jgi:hypothetical protein
MPVETITCFVFVDFENVPEIDLGLVAGKPVHVTLLLGKNQKRVDLPLVQQIHRLAAQVELVEVGASGHNALDLTLAIYLGQAVQRAPRAHFCIVSKDKDFDPMISHLHGRQIKVERHDSFAALPFVPQSKKPAPAVKKPAEDRRSKVTARLKNPTTRNRPSSRKALLAHLKTALGKEASDASAEAIIRELGDVQALTIDAHGKVSYPAAP